MLGVIVVIERSAGEKAMVVDFLEYFHPPISNQTFWMCWVKAGDARWACRLLSQPTSTI
jgi:hypothetical protein